jgi:hypothetical protein
VCLCLCGLWCVCVLCVVRVWCGVCVVCVCVWYVCCGVCGVCGVCVGVCVCQNSVLFNIAGCVMLIPLGL